MHWNSILWFVVMVVFLMMEASTVSLVSAWFAIGALAALITGLFGGWFWLQVVVFLVVSGVMLALLRPIVKKHFTPKLIKTNVDAVVGSTGRVMEEINNDLSAGRVKLAGLEWAARSSNHVVIPADTMIRVDRVEGVKVYVTAIESEILQEV